MVEAQAGSRSRRLPPSSRWSGTPAAFPAMSHSAMSMALMPNVTSPPLPSQ